MGERVPQHVQNLVIRDYCKRKNLTYLLSATEYIMPNSFSILEHILDEMDGIDGIVAYSLFQLPNNIEMRRKIYAQLIKNHKTIHFAVENMYGSVLEEFKKIEIIWGVRCTLPKCVLS